MADEAAARRRPSEVVWAARHEGAVGPVPGLARPTAAQTAERVQAGEPWQPAMRELLDGLLMGAQMAALTALGEQLRAKGVVADLYVVGGAAIALAYDDRRSTRDIDAVFVPKIIVYQAAARVAEERGLPAGWLKRCREGVPARPRNSV